MKQLILFDYRLRNLLLLFFQQILFSKISDRQLIQKIVIFRTGSIGDNICALPAVSVIRLNFPNAQIDILTNAGKSSAVSLDKLIDKTQFNEIIDYLDVSKKVLFQKLKQKRYDLFIELPQYDSPTFRQLRNQFIVKLLGVKHAFGWKVSQTMLFPKFQEKNIIFNDERLRLLEILSANRLNTNSSSFIYSKDPINETTAKNIVTSLQIGEKSNNIGIVIGSKVPRNKWPLEYFKKVSEYYLNKKFNVLIFGGQEDQLDANTLELAKNAVNFCGKLKPIETAEVMKYCSVVITNDTGPMHLSYMVGTPVVALFSSRDFPNKWYPPKDDGINKIFRSENIACSLCFTRSCSDNICLKKISPEEVISATNHILESENVRN